MTFWKITGFADFSIECSDCRCRGCCLSVVVSQYEKELVFIFSTPNVSCFPFIHTYFFGKNFSPFVEKTIYCAAIAFLHQIILFEKGLLQKRWYFETVAF